MITSIEKRAGASVRQGNSILSIVDPTVLMLRCSVVPEVARQISSGMQVRFEPHENLLAAPVFGTVLGFGPRAHQDQENRVEVLCKVKSQDEHIREGTFGRAVFVRKQNMADKPSTSR